MSAYEELLEALKPEESVEGVCFGDYGWEDYGESQVQIEKQVPPNLRGTLLTLEKARPLMEGWSFFSPYGSPKCYATYIWTNQRVFWVTEYDGATCLASVPRHPQEGMPSMDGDQAL